MKRRIKKVYKRLPPHSYEPHPLTNTGEASKPLIIGIIAIVAVIALSLLLLFSDQFVGKALYVGQQGTAGLVYPQKVYENNEFTVQVKANVGNEQAARIVFELDLPQTPHAVTCKNLVHIDTNGWPVKTFTCDSNQNKVKYDVITNAPVSNEINIASITFNGVPAETYDFKFSKFQIKKLDANLISLSNVAETSQLIVKAPACGDGDVNQMSEQCDDGNQDNTDSCVQCQAASCGDGFVQTGVEQCDGSELAGKTCVTQGFESGTLSCNSCMLVTSMCVAAPSCADSTKNGQETDVDCGPNCPKCANEKMCLTNDDCMSNYCDSGICKDVPAPVCDPNNPGLCTTSMTCLEANNYWYGTTCYDACPMNTNDDDADKVCESQQPEVFSCTGTTPTNAQLCSGDDTGLSQNTAKTAVSACGMAKCEYQCNTNLVPNADGSDCVSSSPPSGETLETPGQPTGESVQGTKITLTDLLPADNVFATKITATEAFTTEVTIYTILYDQDGKVLALKSEKLAGLAQGQTYTAVVNYPEANIKKKSVIVYDVKPGVEVAGSLSVQLSE